MKNGHLNICLKQSEDFLSVRKGLRDIKSQVLRTGLAIQDFQSIELVLAEVLNNIVEHGDIPYNPSDVQLTWELYDNQFCAMIIDPGVAYNPKITSTLNSEDIGSLPNELPEGGFGWSLVVALCSAIKYERFDQRNVLNLKIPLHS